MLDLGVIEESMSEWSSPIVQVLKPDCTVRFCIDFCRVNAVLKCNAYPLPRIDEKVEERARPSIYLPCT